MNTKEITQQYRLNQWTEIIRECRSSEQTVKGWCHEHDINLQSYYYWLRRIRTVASETLPSLGSPNMQIVPLNIQASDIDSCSVATSSSSSITIHINSVTLEVHENTSDKLIESTLRALHNVR